MKIVTTNEICQKVVIASYSDARRDIALLGRLGRRLFVYKCMFCNSLHLTSSKPNWQAKQAQNKANRRRQRYKIRARRKHRRFTYTGGLQFYLSITDTCSISLLRHKTRILQRGRFIINKKK